MQALPSWFDLRGGRTPLGSHSRPDRLFEEDGELRLQSVARGQEFVLDAAEYPEALGWARGFVEGA